MRLSIAVIAIIGACLFTSGCDRSGGACNPIGKTETDSNSQLWSCVKNQTTGKGYWYKGKY